MEGITLSAFCCRGNWRSLLDDLPHIFSFYVRRSCDVWHADGWPGSGGGSQGCNEALSQVYWGTDLSRQPKLTW